MKCQKMGGILEPRNPLGNSVWELGAPFARGQWSSLSGSHLPAFLKCYALCSFTSPAQPLWHVIQLHLLSLRLYLWEETDWSYVSHVCFAGNISDIFLRTERKRLLEWTGEGEGRRTKGRGDTWCQRETVSFTNLPGAVFARSSVSPREEGCNFSQVSAQAQRPWRSHGSNSPLLSVLHISNNLEILHQW